MQIGVAITKGCRQRCIYLTHRLTIEALETYLTHRIEHGFGTVLAYDRYRGLSPTTKLILTHKGSKFGVVQKWRFLGDKGEENPPTLEAGFQFEDKMSREADRPHVGQARCG